MTLISRQNFYLPSKNLVKFVNVTAEFCSYPGHTQLVSVRYRECVLEDNFKYPNNIEISGTKESRYNGFVSNVGGEYGDLHFANQQPSSGYPNSATSLDMIFR